MSAISQVLNKLKPYDSSLNEDMSMYDHLPYQRDIDLCNEHTIALYSGNILKYYYCSIKEPCQLDHRDDLALAKIRQHEQEQALLEQVETKALPRQEKAMESIDLNDDEGTLTDEQIDNLLNQKGSFAELTDEDLMV